MEGTMTMTTEEMKAILDVLSDRVIQLNDECDALRKRCSDLELELGQSYAEIDELKN